jgi:CRP/FNR family cyclic AMP-dependent transcriptional regulator
MTSVKRRLDPFIYKEIRFMDAVSHRAEMIDSTAWGIGFDWNELIELANYMEDKEVRQGEILLREGETNLFLTIVVKGSLAINKGNTPSVANRIAVVNQGGTFGEISLFDAEPSSATVVAATDAKLLRMSEKNFNNMITKTRALGVRFMLKITKLLSQRLRRTSDRLADFRTS